MQGFNSDPVSVIVLNVNCLVCGSHHTSHYIRAANLMQQSKTHIRCAVKKMRMEGPQK